jgi:hypothetical protein
MLDNVQASSAYWRIRIHIERGPMIMLDRGCTVGILDGAKEDLLFGSATLHLQDGGLEYTLCTEIILLSMRT